MTAVETPVHLARDERGIIRVSGTRSKMTQVVRDHLERGWSAAEIHRQYPHLSVAAVHAALAYYFDHQAEVAAEMEREDRLVEEIGRAHV